MCLSFQYNVQTDMSRRQLDYEIQRLHNIMKENMGSSEEISQRHKNRLQRIQRIETDMMRAQQMHKEQVGGIFRADMVVTTYLQF